MKWKRPSRRTLIGGLVLAALLAAVPFGYWFSRPKTDLKNASTHTLLSLMKSKDRVTSGEAEEEIYNRGTKAMPGLVAALHEKDSVSDAFYTSLFKLLPDALSAKLPPPSTAAERRIDACEMLQGAGPEAKAAVPVLVELTKASDYQTRIHAILVLHSLGPDAEAARTRLLELLHSTNSMERIYSAGALNQMRPPPQEARQALLNEFNPHDGLQRRLRVAGQFLLATDVPPIAVETFKEGLLNTNTVFSALFLVEKMNRETQLQLLPELIVAQKSNDLAWGAFSAIAKLGPDAHAAIPEIIREAVKPKVDQEWLEKTLLSIGPPTDAEMPAVIAALQDSSADIRRAAFVALDRVDGRSTNTSQLLPLLLAGLDDPQARVRECAGHALIGLKSAALPVLPEVLERLRSGKRDGVIMAETLSGLGPQARGAVPLLEQMLKENGARSQAAAAWALWKIDGQTSAPIVTLEQVLAKKSLSDWYWEAERRLKEIKAAQATAVAEK